VILFAKNTKIKDKYWEQELIAIRETYQKGQGIRSTNLNASFCQNQYSPAYNTTLLPANRAV